MSIMQDNKSVFFLIVVTILLLFSKYSFAETVLEKVVIDAGHGGKDPGTLARNKGHYNEKVIALKIALKLGRLIEQKCKGVKVVYTRKKDQFISLKKRAQIANNANANLFISIHVDAVSNKKVRGASVYVLGLHRSEDNLKVAMRENAVMLQEDDYKTQYAGFNPQDPESYIIFSLMQNQYLENSVMMANFVSSALKNQTKRYIKGVKQAGFYVLREVAMPSILIETGYITNYSDAKYLSSAYGQKKTANAIFQAFLSYKKHLEKSTVNLETVVEKSGDTPKAFFSVQLLYAKKKVNLNTTSLKKLKNVIEYEENGAYRYLYGETINYNQALKLRREARKIVKDAYIVGIYKGKKVDKKKIIELLKEEK